ncbi:MAG: LamB/YcsF family protein [Pyrinomonadaceae bacterium]|nr:LamB/YcsF family protein [Pyrinomonadaceae bacterium]
MLSVDLNCDMGEGCPFDTGLMRYISSVNIACGAHAGDRETMRRIVELANEYYVSIGAHPGYPDPENFGRKEISFPDDELELIISKQILELREICDSAGAELAHVKPHGALYNRSAREPATARVVARAVRNVDPELILLGLSGSYSISEAENAGLRTASEAFADRTYCPDGSLMPRNEPNALITDPGIAADQALAMVANGQLDLGNGTKITVRADTICIHGDGQNPIEMVQAIRELMLINNITIRPLNV